MRLADYADEVQAAEANHRIKIQELKVEETNRINQALTNYFIQRVSVLKPFVKRLQSLQEKTFSLPKEKVSVTLDRPNADLFRFPIELQYKNERWRKYWKYTDRKMARDLWKTRAHLQTQGLYQLEGDETIKVRLTRCRVSHPATGEYRDFLLGEPREFSEIASWNQKWSRLLWSGTIHGDQRALIGTIVHIAFDPALIYKNPTTMSRLAELVKSSTDLKVLELEDVGLRQWVLVETPSGNKGWIHREWIAEKEPLYK
jgi:hypothetical protein